MKKIVFWLAFIVGILALIGSCAKKDEDSSTATATAFTPTTTASGSITVGSATMSGTYASDCNDLTGSSAIGNYVPSDVLANRDVLVVTGSDNVSEEMYLYTDTSCTNLSGYLKDGNDNFTVGDASGSNYKVTYVEATFKVTAVTSTAESFYESYFSTNNITNQGTAVDLVVGTEYSMSSNGNTYMNLYSVTSTQVQTGDDSSQTQPTAMDSLVMTKQ